MEQSFRVLGYGSSVPIAISSAELERIYSWPHGWCERHSGVEQRHWVEPGQSNGDLGAAASKIALERAELDINEIDLLLFAGATYDHTLPNEASIIKEWLDPEDRADMTCMDIDTTCLSFLTALEIAVEKLNLGKCQTVLLVAAEVASNGLNPAHRETFSLFGDAAVAFVLSAGDQMTLKHTKFRTFSKGVYDTIIQGGGNRHHFKYNAYDPEVFSFKMNGRKLLMLAMKYLPGFMDEFLAESGVDWAEIDACILHQASKAGLQLFTSAFPVHEHQIELPSTLATHGNCIAASLPLTLMHYLETVKPGESSTCILVGTSAGFAIGASCLTINY